MLSWAQRLFGREPYVMFDALKKGVVQHGPSLLRLPLRLTPFAVLREVLTQVLTWQFRQALAEGELDELASRWVRIDINDLELSWCISVEHDRPVVRRDAPADVRFSGNANDLLLVAARRQDPDTLFFQRRLVIEGDTELGLYVKNLMDAIDLDSMPTLLRTALEHLADWVESAQNSAHMAPHASFDR